MISGPAIVEEFRRAFVGDGAREQGLAGAGRAVEQHALGRVDAEPLEQLGMAQRKLDHFAQRVDRVAHSAEIVIGDVGAALAVLGGIFGKQLDGGLAVDVDDALGRRRHDHQPQLLQRERRRVQHLPDVVGHVGVDALVAGGGDRCRPRPAAGRRRCASSASAEPCSRTLGCAGANTTRVAALDSALRTSTKSPEPTPALARCRPSRRMMSILRPRHRGGSRGPRSSACRRSRSRRLR